MSCRRLVRIIMVLAGLCSFAPDSAPAADMVRFAGYRPGTVVVKTGERRLYYVLTATAPCVIRSVSAAGANNGLATPAFSPNTSIPPGCRHRWSGATTPLCPR
jgi:lipoprotein-anchoring transpeptidase ErfK/SrfK